MVFLETFSILTLGYVTTLSENEDWLVHLLCINEANDGMRNCNICVTTANAYGVVETRRSSYNFWVLVERPLTWPSIHT
jgi:hypothetical protein